jgi:uncharacterized membrane protein YhaH (DUF805 family)
MRGNVIGYSLATNRGAISGHNGERYEFTTDDWQGGNKPAAGMAVDFQPSGSDARQIFLVASPVTPFSWGWLLFSFQGRATRSDLWLRFTLPYAAIAMILGMVIGASVSTSGEDPGVAIGAAGILGFFYLIALWPNLAVAIKRAHDRDHSGWFILVGLIPVIGSIWLFIELGCLRGTVGDNRFGGDPANR